MRTEISISTEDDGDDDFYNTVSLFDGSPRALYSMMTMLAAKFQEAQSGKSGQERLCMLLTNASNRKCCTSFQTTPIGGSNNPVGGLK